MSSRAARLAALETIARAEGLQAVGSDLVLVRINRFDQRGVIPEEAQRLITGAPGEEWLRGLDETEESFIARARQDMPAPRPGIARILVVCNTD